ncbi:MAG: tRNA (adenosine(37)-N6)-threonylcarbamoyltransferase complex ATPase subunit type 1 TsaE, partial [Prochlorococcaceae cyanobacterium ETNP1_MAG_9]|nr:tRNA (adenosine(37)-N6)-threonylcarbamoyltransferase complex ATPase subunit type 1 TsaE [Prochlorococcaceae cyanobacterium ETNP1_MAG_9]
IPLFHLDLYRLENHIEANDLFLQAEEEAREINALMVVDWPERLNLSVTDALRIKMEFCSNGRLVHNYLPATSTKNEITSS